MQYSCLSVPSMPGLSALNSPQGSLGNPSLASRHVLPDHRQGRTTVNSKRDSLSRVTLQAHDLCCRTRLTLLVSSLSVFPLPLPLPFLPPLPLESFPSCFASSPSRGDRIFRTCGTSCLSAAAAHLSPSVLCSSHWLHDASGKLPTLLPSHARHPRALIERGLTSGISPNSTTSASQALCPSLDSEQSPHASHLRSSTPDRAHTPRASQACLQRSRIGAGSRVALLFSTWCVGRTFQPTAAKHGALLPTQRSPRDPEQDPRCCAEAK